MLPRPISRGTGEAQMHEMKKMMVNNCDISAMEPILMPKTPVPHNDAELESSVVLTAYNGSA
jgi:hypothetical protein